MKAPQIKTPRLWVGIRNISDYSPFGVLLKERTVETANFRRGFQGQEHDDEVKGEGNSVNFKYRMHDPRVGRFFAVDPLKNKYPYYSVYSFSGNIVIHAIELEGLENFIKSDGTVIENLWGPIDPEIARESGAEFFGYKRTCTFFTSTGVGEQIIENVSRLNNNYTPTEDSSPNVYLNCGGDCFAVSKVRVDKAMKQVTKLSLSSNVKYRYANQLTFNRIWNVSGQQFVPEEYEGKGSAGAIEYAGLGEYVTEEEIWSGVLQPGAVIQVWASENGFQHDGSDYGHSFIFLGYTYDSDGVIDGMNIADQGYQNGNLQRSAWGTWHGGNFGFTTTEDDIQYSPLPEAPVEIDNLIPTVENEQKYFSEDEQ
jgi:RHS repeat-associated protein